MKTLIVGGTGGIGAHVALRLRKDGHDVTLASRRGPAADSPVADFPVITGSYVDDEFNVGQLEGFDNLVFSACNDIRQVPQGSSEKERDAYFIRANGEAVPRFFKLAKAAGIRRSAYVGSFYPQAKPELVEKLGGYVLSRKLADEGARSYADASFNVVSLNAPWIVGGLPGMLPLNYVALANWALGRMPDLPSFAMPGGTNFMSLESVSDAIVGGLAKGENGRGYLVGDENLHFKDFFGYFLKAAGNDMDLPVIDKEHPIMPDAALYAGRVATIFYEPEGAEELGYKLNDVERVVKYIVDQVR